MRPRTLARATAGGGDSASRSGTPAETPCPRPVSGHGAAGARRSRTARLLGGRRRLCRRCGLGGRARRRRRLRLRMRARRRRGSGSRSGRLLARRKQRQRVDVSARVIRAPDAEVDVRLGVLRLAARPDRPDRLALGDAVARRDEERTEVRECYRPAVRRTDGQRLAVGRKRPRERHATRRRSEHRCTGGTGDVDPAVTLGGVPPAAVVEVAQDLAGRRPRPRRRDAGRSERDHDRGDHSCQSGEHVGREASRRVGCCQRRLQRRAVEPVPGNAGQA
jgi:hypothetical protein